MNEEMEKKPEAPESAPASPDIGKLIEMLKEKGLDDEKILVALDKAAQDGKISPEDLEKAKQLLGNKENEADDQAEAEKMFGMKFVA